MSEKINKDNEPLFTAIKNDDIDFRNAYSQASQTINYFVEQLQSDQSAFYSAKLRFRDPDLSEKLGEDRFLFIWLTNVHHHPDENLLSGEFFELPPEMHKWHEVGQRLGFEKDDVFDWMILDSMGRLQGGFTLRVSRLKLPHEKRSEFDKHIGVNVYL